MNVNTMYTTYYFIYLCIYQLNKYTYIPISVADSNGKVNLRLKSAKMVGLKDLLCADKLNTNAIQLQLTALSQISGPTTSNSNYFTEDLHSRPKRSRRGNVEAIYDI